MTPLLNCSNLPTVELHLPHDAAAVPAARHSVASIVAYAADDLVDRVSLVISELATNVVLHAEAPFTLRASYTDQQLLLEVHDETSEGPHDNESTDLDQGGRGMDVVDAVADRWGTTFHEPGKTVWAAFDAAGGSPLRPA